MSWALRKSSKLCSARRHRPPLPGRAGCPRGRARLSARHSGSRGRVPVAVVDVVDVVAVRHGRVPAVLAVLVPVVLGHAGVRRRVPVPSAGSANGSAQPLSAAQQHADRVRRGEAGQREQHDRRARGRRRRTPRRPRRRARPACPAPSPTTSVVRNARVTCCDGGDRHHHQRADQQQPDGAHRHGHGDRGHHRDQQVVEPHVEPGDLGELLVLGDREQLRRQPDAPARPRPPPAPAVTQTSAARDGGDRAEEVGVQSRGALPGEPGEQHAAGDAAVEQQRERHVAAGAAALADHLDDDRADDRHDHRGEGRGGAGEQAEGDAGDRDVPDAVAHQRQPALHEVGADRGRRQAGEQGAEQRPHHEVVGQQAHRLAPASGPAARTRRARGRRGPRPVGVVVVVAVRRSASVKASIGGPS